MIRASLEDSAAYLFDYSSRANRAFGDVKRTVTGRNSDFELLVSRITQLDGGFGRLQQDCEFHSTLKLCIIDADTIAILADPVDCKIHRSGSSMRRILLSLRFSAIEKVEGGEKSVAILRRVSPMETKVQFATELDFGGPPVKKMSIKEELERQLRGYTAMSSYFLNRLCIAELHEKDGIALGELLYEREKDSIGISSLNCVALNSLQAEFPWFEAMIGEVLKNKLRPAAPAIDKKAECLSIAEAKKIGESLSISLATNITAAAGVDE